LRIIVFIVTALIQGAFAAIAFLTLLVGLNGYSEKQATPGLAFFVVLSVASALGLGAGSAFAAKRIVEKKSFGKFAASAAAIAGFAAIGVVILIAGFFVALILSEIMRR
jgi:hypothetical protein